jgi:DNA-binding NtrC family response regulator
MFFEAARVLIVDDDQFVREFAVHAIEFGINRQVMTFESGFRAWQFIFDQSSRIDVIIADANIPDMNGLELLTSVKKNFPEKKFILTSSLLANEKTAYQMGADAFIAKPFDIQDLFTVIEKIICPSDPTRS